MIKTYSRVKRINEFSDRLKYLSCNGTVCEDTFGPRRYLNQILYHSSDWRRIRNLVIERDDGCDLAHPDYPLPSGNIYIHHINPIALEDILERSDLLFDMENLICVSFKTHQFIHYGITDPKKEIYTPRVAGDTCLWK